MVQNDSIEYELVNWEKREVWKCQGSCQRFRHRPTVKGLMPAICCGQPAKLVDRYSQPRPLIVSEPFAQSTFAQHAELPDQVLESVMAQMQAAALLFPEPTQEPGKGAYKS